MLREVSHRSISLLSSTPETNVPRAQTKRVCQKYGFLLSCLGRFQMLKKEAAFFFLLLGLNPAIRQDMTGQKDFKKSLFQLFQLRQKAQDKTKPGGHRTAQGQ